jgi:CheY-like chemotaxis protein
MQHLAAVMVIEDDDNVRHLMAEILVDGGLEVIEFTNGPDALARLESCRPSVITLDLALPGMSGLDFLWALKAMPSVADTPVVLVSGAPGTIREQLGRHVAQVIGKPFRADAFLNAVHHAAGLHAQIS